MRHRILFCKRAFFHLHSVVFHFCLEFSFYFVNTLDVLESPKNGRGKTWPSSAMCSVRLTLVYLAANRKPKKKRKENKKKNVWFQKKKELYYTYFQNQKKHDFSCLKLTCLLTPMFTDRTKCREPWSVFFQAATALFDASAHSAFCVAVGVSMEIQPDNAFCAQRGRILVSRQGVPPGVSWQPPNTYRWVPFNSNMDNHYFFICTLFLNLA